MTIAPLPRTGLTVRDVARLEDELNTLQNSFGQGAFADGITRDKIKLIESQLAAACAPPSEDE